MKYWKIINLLDSKANWTPKYEAEICIEVNNNTKTGSYETADQIKFKTAMPKSCFCDYSDTYILVKRITGVETDVIPIQVDKTGEKVIF